MHLVFKVFSFRAVYQQIIDDPVLILLAVVGGPWCTVGVRNASPRAKFRSHSNLKLASTDNSNNLYEEVELNDQTNEVTTVCLSLKDTHPQVVLEHCSTLRAARGSPQLDQNI